MRLIDDAGWVLKNAWSVRFSLLGTLFGALAATLGILAAKEIDLPVGPVTLAVTFGIATGLAGLASIAARFTKQDRSDADASE